MENESIRQNIEGRLRKELHKNSDDDFIIDLLFEYRIYTSKSYHFNDFVNNFMLSMEGHKIDNVEDFSEELFYVQYDFFREKDAYLRECGNIKATFKIQQHVIALYRYLHMKYKLKYSKLFVQVISSKNFYQYYDKGYEFLHHSLLDEVPNKDKICILPTKETMINSHNRNNSWRSFDFTECEVRYRNNLKKFVWENYTSSNSLNHNSSLENFLNLSYEFQYNKIANIGKRSQTKEFSSEFLWNYWRNISNLVENSENLRNIFKIIRKFLLFYQEEYGVENSDIDIFSLKGLSKSVGGQVITENDLNLISHAFAERTQLDSKNRIYEIVFELFLNTRLRIGEIVNLKRDCMPPNENNEYSLKFISKTSDGLVKTISLSMLNVNLIEEAISLTKTIARPGTLYEDYIFVEDYMSNDRFECKRIAFGVMFDNIVLENKDELENSNYTQNNIRHTFIDNAYSEGVTLGMGIHEIADIVGNSFKIANKHYRDKNNVLNYIEAMYEVCISDVEINGTIVERVGDIDRPVQQGLGDCKYHGCRFEMGKCLICSDFITYTNRKHKFVEKLDEINVLIEESNDLLEIEELTSYKKVVAKYLYEIESILQKNEVK